MLTNSTPCRFFRICHTNLYPTISDHPLKRRATRRARAGSARYRCGSRKIARCGSVRSNRSLKSDPGTNTANPNGKPGGILSQLSEGDAEEGRSHLLSRGESLTNSVQVPTKTTVKQSIINLFLNG